jgi:membrane-associated phospholipid phosphatase
MLPADTLFQNSGRPNFLEVFMDALMNTGINWIAALQGLGGWLTLPMQAFSFLGSEDFFMLVLPALYWSVDAALGLRVGVILLVGSSLNDMLKLAFHGPRPYWFSTKIQAFASETAFGLPSGHAQSAVGVWGMLASQIRKRWAWVVALLLMLLVGLSRIYLGVHFPTDVLLGWLVGAVILWLVLRLWEPVAAWLKKLSLGRQILEAFALSLLLIVLALIPYFFLQSSGWQVPAAWLQNAAQNLPGGEAPNPTSLSGLFSTTGTLFGLLAGLAWLNKRGGYHTRGSGWQRILRYVAGVVGVLVIRYGLKAIFPEGEGWLVLVFQYVRYAAIGAWVSAGAPLLFFALKLAQKDR